MPDELVIPERVVEAHERALAEAAYPDLPPPGNWSRKALQAALKEWGAGVEREDVPDHWAGEQRRKAWPQSRLVTAWEPIEP